jgi:protein-S-isoprenylcysteine O-methyltransferase Ste14
MIPGLTILACWVALVLYWRISERGVKAAAERQGWQGRLARLPVWLGYIALLVGGVYPLGPRLFAKEDWSAWLGAEICALGLFLAVWARKTLGVEWSQDVELKQGHRLVTSGPYSFVRHPIYTCHLVMGLGTAITFGRIAGFAGCLLFFIGFWTKLRQEEELLVRHFPEEYPDYKKRVKVLVPFVF